MVSKELGEAAVEVNVILSKSSLEIQRRIPNEFKHFLTNIASKSYRFQYDNTKSLIEQNLKTETKCIIALIYRDYICDDNERKEYIKKCDELKNIRYNSDNLFNRNNKVQQGKIQTIIEKKWYNKIVDKIKLFLSK